MQAYAKAEQPALSEWPRALALTPSMAAGPVSPMTDPNAQLLDGLLGRIADLVVERLMERIGTSGDDQHGEWMDARGAAEYLAPIATPCASWLPSERFRRTRTGRVASPTSAATSSTSGAARTGPAERQA